MTRRPAAVLAVLTLLVLLAGGCGIPDNSEVAKVGPGPSQGPSAGENREPTRSSRTSTLNRSQFIRNYLEAAAGDLEGALERAKAFMSPTAAAAFKPSAETIEVVRMTDEGPLSAQSSNLVTVNAQKVGVLDRDGVLIPTDEGTTTPYTFTVTEVVDEGLFITKLPSVLMISDAALADFYEQRTIYFWNTGYTTLVPDVRYLPLSVPDEAVPNEILRWLTGGASPWLEATVEELPDNTRSNGNVPAVANNTLTIDLSAQALPADDRDAPDRLRRQLMWSLRRDLPGTLALKVGQNQWQWSGSDYLASNAAYRSDNELERFVLYRKQIHRLAGSARNADEVPVLPEAANRNIHAAEFARSSRQTYAALVTGAGAARALQVAGAPPGTQGTLRTVPLPAPIGQPAWAVTPEEPADGVIGLVPAKGRLFSFSPDGGAPRLLEWSGAPANITAVSVAPDGRRIALVAGGRLYLGVLSSGGENLEVVQTHGVSTPMAVVTSVAWSSEGLLVLAGKLLDNGRVGIIDLSIDGGLRIDRLPDLGSDPVTYLAADPASPTAQSTAAAVSFDTGGLAYDANTEAERINVSDLAEPQPNPPPAEAPTRPFFLH